MTVKKFVRAIIKRIKKVIKIYTLIQCIPTLYRYLIWCTRKGFILPPAAFGCSRRKYIKQKEYSFPQKIKFSILVPLYNTPENFLKEMIGSVLFQTYENWELCLADGSDTQHSYVGDICKQIAEKENRIKYKKLEQNRGISENTNACLEMVTGDYISLFDHDDLLHPSALFETMRAICEKDAEFVYTDEAIFQSPNLQKIQNTHFKPDFAPDYFYMGNYLCHFSSFKKSLLDEIGKFNSETDGAQDYDLFLRLSEHTDKIIHVQKNLYYWRASPTSTASGIGAKNYAIEAGKQALQNHINRMSLDAKVSYDNNFPYKVEYKIKKEYLISIVIVCKNMRNIFKCIKSIINITEYKNYEIILVIPERININEIQNNKIINNDKIKIHLWKKEENHSAMNNYGFSQSTGDFVVYLNSDNKILSSKWIEEMLMFAQRDNIGAVGAKVYFKGNKIYNAGVILGIKGCIGISHKGIKEFGLGYAFRTGAVVNLSAVTEDCMMVSRKTFEKLGGFNENFVNTYYAVDFCLRLRQKGFFIVGTPYAELYHNPSNIKNYYTRKVIKTEKQSFLTKWKDVIQRGDPYYNPNFTLKTEDFAITGKIFPNAEIPKF